MNVRRALAFAVVFASLGAVAFGQSPPTRCAPQNILIAFDKWEGTSDLCGNLPVGGTLSGTYVTCLVEDPNGLYGVSVYPLSPDPDAYAAYYDDWIETPQGRLHLRSLVVGVWSRWIVQGGLSKILPEGSTGDFEGATGYLTLSPEWQTDRLTDPASAPRTYRFTGRICTP